MERKLKAIYWCDSDPNMPETREELDRFETIHDYLDMDNIKIVCSFDVSERGYDVLLYDFGGFGTFFSGSSLLQKENGLAFLNLAIENPSKWYCVVSTFTAGMVREFARELEAFQNGYLDGDIANLFFDLRDFAAMLEATGGKHRETLKRIK